MVSDDKPGHVGEGLHCAGQVLAGRLVEVEEDRRVVAPSQFLPEGIKHRLALVREAAEDQDDLRGDGVDDVANPFIVEEQIDELGDLKVVDSDVGFVKGA